MAPKKKQSSSLGRAVIKSRFQGQRTFGVDEGKLVILFFSFIMILS